MRQEPQRPQAPQAVPAHGTSPESANNILFCVMAASGILPEREGQVIQVLFTLSVATSLKKALKIPLQLVFFFPLTPVQVWIHYC